MSCLQKRELLNQPVVSLGALTQWGRQYEEAGLIHDAVELYEKANAREDLGRLLEEARADGDVFLVKRISRVLGMGLGREQWAAVARKAEETGKQLFAAEAARLAGEEVPAGKETVATTA